jgi:hypothetical protein
MATVELGDEKSSVLRAHGIRGWPRVPE